MTLWAAVNAEIVRDLHFGGGFVGKAGGGDGDEEGKVCLHRFNFVSQNMATIFTGEFIYFTCNVPDS